jgi:hypothetical protein
MLRMRVVTPIRSPLTAAIVGSTCRLRLFQIRTGNVWACTPARNIEISNPSNEARNAKRAADNTPVSTTRQNTRTSSTVKNSSVAHVLLSVICLPEIDLLSRPKDSALLGRYI